MIVVEKQEDFLKRDGGALGVKPRKFEIVWTNIFIFSALHIGGFYGAYISWVYGSWKLFFWDFAVMFVTGFGITAGAHRLWTHRSFKAKWPLRLLLVIFYSTTFQYDIITWVTDHRCHHKWVDTDGDPHTATRGFFYSHIGWLLVRKHPEVIRKGKTLDLRDLYSDPLLVFQRRYHPYMLVLFCFFIPIAVPVVFWNENWLIAVFTSGFWRNVFTLHLLWTINSFAHSYGSRPYDPDITAVENRLFALFSLGEGYHNYHHKFPQDYKDSEAWWCVNPTTFFIDIFASIGWAYDRKVADPGIVRQVVAANAQKYR